MKRILFFLLTLSLLLLGCGGTNETPLPNSDAPAVTSPALVMFYTDA